MSELNGTRFSILCYNGSMAELKEGRDVISPQTQQLLDNHDNPVAVRHEHEEEFVEKIHEREEATGRELQVVADENRDVKLPLKVLYEEEKLSVSKMPIWYLQALGSMTVKEYNDFVKSHQTELNINEIAASDLLQGVIKKDAVAVARFWDLQKTLLKSKNVVQQINNIHIAPDTAIRNLMDDISDGLFAK